MCDDFLSTELLLQMRKSSLDHGSWRLAEIELVNIFQFIPNIFSRNPNPVYFIFYFQLFLVCSSNQPREQMSLTHREEFRTISFEISRPNYLRFIHITILSNIFSCPSSSSSIHVSYVSFAFSTGWLVGLLTCLLALNACLLSILLSEISPKNFIFLAIHW